MKQITNRIPYWDNIKGFLIVLVVVGHLLEALPNGSVSALYKFIYLFHMPLFVFCSGYLAKYNFKKICKRFLLPYIIIQPLCCLFQSQPIQYFTPIWILWYLVALSFWYLTIPILDQCHTKMRPIVVVLSVILACILGYDNSIGYFASISRTIVFYPYFVIGYYGKKYYIENTYNHLVNEHKHIIKLIVVVLLVFIIGMFVFYAHMVDARWLYGAYSYQSAHYSIIFRIMQYFIALVIGCFILLFIPRKKTFFTKWGFNSFLIYISHIVIIPLIQLIIKYIELDIIIQQILCIVLSIAFCVSLNYIVIYIKKLKMMYKGLSL